jgi:hypothetical protein
VGRDRCHPEESCCVAGGGVIEPAKDHPADLLYQTVEERLARPVDVAELGESLIRELRNRVEDPVKAAEIPGTTLMKLTSYFIEKQEREARDRDARLEDRLLSPAELIDHPGLPRERREELVREQLQRVEVDRVMLEAKLEELVAK